VSREAAKAAAPRENAGPNTRPAFHTCTATVRVAVRRDYFFCEDESPVLLPEALDDPLIDEPLLPLEPTVLLPSVPVDAELPLVPSPPELPLPLEPLVLPRPLLEPEPVVPVEPLIPLDEPPLPCCPRLRRQLSNSSENLR